MPNQSPNFDADDALLTLLTDALRAGPASPQWSRALATLEQKRPAGVDDYQMLLRARQDLESGRRYREVRGGPEFGRRVRQAIEAADAESKVSRRPWFAGLLILGSLLAVAGVLGIALWATRGSGLPAENLMTPMLNSNLGSATFDAPLPPGWRVIGPLALDPMHGLQPLESTTRASTRPGVLGGAVLLDRPTTAGALTAIDTVLQIGRAGDDLVPELFVTDDPRFSRERATSPHELAWLVRSGKLQVVLPSGRFAGTALPVQNRGRFDVRLVVGHHAARVSVGDQVLYEGPSELGDTPRFVGIRLLRRGGGVGDTRVLSIQVRQ